MEGPFGDHFGHYSHAAPFPVLRIRKVTHRKDPIYLAAVVGKPPQEDRYLGDALQEIMSPLDPDDPSGSAGSLGLLRSGLP